MPVDVEAAVRFMYTTARLLDRHRLAVVLGGGFFGGGSFAEVDGALLAYRNDDGGFGHALEPDVRGPHSETTSTLFALEVLREIDSLDDPVVGEAAGWVAGIAGPDGGVPFVLADTERYPHGPWMVPQPGGSHLTFGYAAVLGGVGTDPGSPFDRWTDRAVAWRDRATAWCWARVEADEPLDAYTVKYALAFLDAAADADRATAAVERIRPLLAADGSLPVPGGTADERLTALTLSPHPGSRSRMLFDDALIEADLDALVRGQQEDGGWDFDFLAWSPGQQCDWRGGVTLEAIRTLREHGRI